MASTETRTGFRLPWSQDHTETDEPSGTAEAATEASESATTTVAAAEGALQETERPDMIDATLDVIEDAPMTAEAAAEAAPAGQPTLTTLVPAGAVAASPAAARKPNKLMIDLAKAMQTAAEGARVDTLEKFAVDTKAYIEAIQVDSATEAAGLRQQADADIGRVREWSKAEIARIREETESRISNRKTALDRELEDHSASTERRIARVQARVDAFDSEMTYFFEVLFAEGDPTKLAAMAQSLPEPPDFDDDTADLSVTYSASAAAAETNQVAESTQTAEPVEDPDAGFAAIAATDQTTGTTEDVAPAAPADVAEPAAVEVSWVDPRIEAMGLSPDAAAEAEAASFEVADARSDQEEIPMIDDDALAARIASLVPDTESQPSAPKAETASTRVVVMGLVSVASIASFKRHLGRVAGVQSVGVSSGPDGEFVFVVAHAPEVALRDAIATLPGFGARVSGETNEGLHVTARDPEAES